MWLASPTFKNYMLLAWMEHFKEVDEHAQILLQGVVLAFFKYNISVIPTCLTFAFRHQNLYNYAVTREKYAKEPSLFLKVLLATTNLLPCLVSHILFPMFPIVRNSEPMFRNQ